MNLKITRNSYGKYEIKADLGQVKYESEWLDKSEVDEIAIETISEFLYYESEKVLKFLKDEYFDDYELKELKEGSEK